ncbi:MAG: hypothetical protein ABFR32_01745 [Bacteroidota bacterium]
MLPQEFSIEYLQEIENKELVKKLILQIKKDTQMVGVDFELNEESSPHELVNYLQIFLRNLIQNDFTTYVNLLYRVDIPEMKLLKLQNLEISILVKKIAILVLKKEWQKVWFRSKNL